MKHTTYRFDSRVKYFFLLVILLSASSFMYRYYTVTECPEVAFELSADTIQAGQMIRFTNRTAGAATAEWDFGDNSPVLYNLHGSHTYQEPGEYVLRLSVNGSCTEYRRLVVHSSKPLIDRMLIPKFSGPKRVEMNKAVRFRCLTENAESYEWRFGETGRVDSRRKNPSYAFSSPGLKTVSLVINGEDKYIATEKIEVMSPPQRPARKRRTLVDQQEEIEEEFIPETPTDYADLYGSFKPKEPAPVVEEKPMTNEELLKVIHEYTQHMAELEQFEPSFCDALEEILVQPNNDRLVKLPDFLNSVRGYELKIKDFRTIRGEGGCILQLIIRYKK